MVHKKITSALIAILMIFTLTGTMFAAPVEYGEELQNMPQNTPTVSFTDLPNTHWAYKYIAEMVNKKVLEGYPDHKFRPDNTISRAEFATIIVKAAGLQAKKVNYSSFSDVKVMDWYSPWIETAKDYLTGYRAANGEYIYNPTAPALREDITVAIVKLKGYDAARLANRSIIEAMFKDYEGISESAKDYVAIAVENGLVSGYPDETFRPQNSITRAEAAALLWRAFMYGNDNKGVGGGDQTTTTPTTPTPPVTQPGTTPTDPQTPAQPQQPSQSTKFSVDTLVGGTGAGDVDGPVSQAKINQVDSMVVDKDNNVYFLDKSLKKVRKFNASNGTVETFRQVDSSFDWDLSKNGNVTRIDHTQFTPVQLAYSHANNGLYLLGYAKGDKTHSDYGQEYYTLIYALTPDVTLSAYGQFYEENSSFKYRFFRIDDQNQFIYGSGGDDDYYSIKNSNIYKAKMNSEVELVGSTKDNTSVAFSYDRYASTLYPMDVIGMNGAIYVFDTGVRYNSSDPKNRLTRIQLFPRKVENIVSFNNMSFDSVTIQNNKFYLSSGTTIYELTTDGKLTTFIDGKDLTYNDGNPIKKISHMCFDSRGNVIVYDDENKAIRRINL
ncbi:S-layer homology domain-containing protein [Paenibacillus sp. JMULE4]|uniref:S-layer homology domain-containing protein n=1 Tax=Paenibacillus sp. JMULE4 TaxID=2518342 RepID=UPI001574F647|nr:S-layer homology domain-containing protein [Paenibacillus sp. JMULE4]